MLIKWVKCLFFVQLIKFVALKKQKKKIKIYNKKKIKLLKRNCRASNGETFHLTTDIAL